MLSEFTNSSYTQRTLSVIIIILIGLLIYVCVTYFKQREHFNEKSYMLGLCSKNCCSTQWPVPVNTTERSKVDPRLVGKKYFTSNLTCNNGVINTGCVCLTQGSKKLLGNRGYVQKLPTGNGLLEADHKVSAFKIMEDQIPRPLNVLGQTTELIGSPTDKIILSGKDENKVDNRIDKYQTVKSEKELVKQFSMPVNNNVITYDNNAINDAIYSTREKDYKMPPVDKLVGRPIGLFDKDIPVSRK